MFIYEAYILNNLSGIHKRKSPYRNNEKKEDYRSSNDDLVTQTDTEQGEIVTHPVVEMNDTSSEEQQMETADDLVRIFSRKFTVKATVIYNRTFMLSKCDRFLMGQRTVTRAEKTVSWSLINGSLKSNVFNQKYDK